MRISIVTDTCWPQPNGVATTLKYLVEGLRERSHQVDLAGPSVLMSEEEGMKVPSIALPGYSEIRVGLPMRRALRQRWNRERPDVIYVASEYALGLSAISAARDLGISVVSGFHTNLQKYAAPYQLALLERGAMKYQRRLHGRADCTLVPSMTLIDHLEREGYRNLKLLSRGVDSQRFSPGKRDRSLRDEWLGHSKTGLIGLYVGRMAAEKNLQLTVRAFAEMRRRLPGFLGIFVGDGPMRAGLKHKHPEFLFPGAKFGNDLARYYASADLFVFPSMTETFGNVILEAMASGLGVVAYDYAASRQHVESGVNGYAVPPGDESAFIAAAVAAGEDPALKNVRSRARLSAMEVGWAAVVEHFEEILQEAVRSRISSTPEKVAPRSSAWRFFGSRTCSDPSN